VSQLCGERRGEEPGKETKMGTSGRFIAGGFGTERAIRLWMFGGGSKLHTMRKMRGRLSLPTVKTVSGYLHVDV